VKKKNNGRGWYLGLLLLMVVASGSQHSQARRLAAQGERELVQRRIPMLAKAQQ
jgi:hypothetical protein